MLASLANVPERISMANSSCIVEHFGRFSELAPSDIELLKQLELDARDYPAGSVLCQAGERAHHFFTLIQGWAGVIRHFPDGRRQVLDLYLPGQIMRLREIGAPEARSDLVALTDVVACPFPRERVDELLAASVELGKALILTLTAEQALLTERIINVARRPAIERLAHFLLELHFRLGADSDRFELPLNQELIGDLLGLSSVHVSRTLSKLRKDGLIAQDNGTIQLLDVGHLRRLSDFCEQYLSRPGSAQAD